MPLKTSRMHIISMGDEDDTNTSGNADKLMTAISEDPDTDDAVHAAGYYESV